MLKITPHMTAAAQKPVSYEPAMNPPTGPYGLPPALQTLPHWSRVSDLGYPNHRHILRRNRHSVSLSRHSSSEENNSSPRSESLQDAQAGHQSDIESQIRVKQRMEYLEKSMEYLRSQHAETLRCLHLEVEHLQRRNRELENSLIMPQAVLRTSPMDVKTPGSVDDMSTNVPTAGHAIPPSGTRNQGSIGSPALANNSEDAKLSSKDAPLLETTTITSEERIKRRRDRLNMDNNGQRAVTAQSVTPPVTGRSVTPPPGTPADSPNQPLRAFPPRPPSFRRLSDVAAADSPLPYLPFNATVEPFQVQLGTNRPRPPTVLECHAIVRYLLADNIKQSNEIVKLKDSLQLALHPVRRRPTAGNTLHGAESASTEQLLSVEGFSQTMLRRGGRSSSTSRSVPNHPSMVSLPPITAPVPPLVSQSNLYPRRSQHIRHERIQLARKSLDSNREEHLPSVE